MALESLEVESDDRPPNNNQSKSCRTKMKMENSSQVTSSLNKSYASAVSMQPPNRAEFERNLSETHFQIKTKEAEMTQIRGTEESLGDYKLTYREMKLSRKELESLRDEFIDAKKKIDVAFEERRKLQDKRDKMKSTLSYTNRAKCQSALDSAKWQYQRRTFTNAKDEQKYVQEIAKLEKNIRQIEDYEKIEAEIGAVSLLIQGHHENKKHLGLKIRDKKLQLDKIHGRLTALKRRREQLGTELKSLRNDKKFLIDKYEHHRRKFNEWKRDQSRASPASKQAQNGSQLPDRKRSQSGCEFGDESRDGIRRTKSWKFGYSPPSLDEPWTSSPNDSPSSAGFTGDLLDNFDEDDADFDDLEPFAREKQLCNTLIQYCQRFTYPEFQADLPQPPADFSNPLPVPTSVTSISEPSSLDAEALALGLFNDERRASGGSGSPGRRRKPHHQTLTKPRQISHADMILEQFSTLEISPPMLYSDAGAVMEVLREKLASFDEQLICLTPTDLDHSVSFTSESGLSGSDSAIAWSMSNLSSLDISRPESSAAGGASPPDLTPATHHRVLVRSCDEGVGESQQNSNGSGKVSDEMRRVLDSIPAPQK